MIQAYCCGFTFPFFVFLFFHNYSVIRCQNKKKTKKKNTCSHDHHARVISMWRWGDLTGSGQNSKLAKVKCRAFSVSVTLVSPQVPPEDGMMELKWERDKSIPQPDENGIAHPGKRLWHNELSRVRNSTVKEMIKATLWLQSASIFYLLNQLWLRWRGDTKLVINHKQRVPIKVRK